MSASAVRLFSQGEESLNIRNVAQGANQLAHAVVRDDTFAVIDPLKCNCDLIMESFRFLFVLLRRLIILAFLGNVEQI